MRGAARLFQWGLSDSEVSPKVMIEPYRGDIPLPCGFVGAERGVMVKRSEVAGNCDHFASNGGDVLPVLDDGLCNPVFSALLSQLS